MIVLVGLAMASLFVMSVFVGQTCLAGVLHIVGRFLEARKLFAESKAAKNALDEANTRVVATTREAERVSAIPQVQIAREAMAEIDAVRNAALAEPRELLRKAALSAVEGEQDDPGAIEAPGLAETRGIETINLEALREMVASIEAATSSKALDEAARVLLKNETRKDDRHA